MSDGRTIPDRASPLRIGAVAYLNTKPLVYGLEQEIAAGGRTSYELSYGVPAVLAEELSGGRIDVALLPVIELAGLAGATVLPGLGITALGAVRSVVLATRTPLDAIRRVALDPESRTSNALVRLLFAEVWGGRPEFVVPREGVDLTELLETCDAAVRIGDKALTDARDRDGAGGPGDTLAEVRTLDLSEAWHRHTGLPFVFAAWVSRASGKRAVDPERLAELVETLERSYRSGVRNTPSIARDAARAKGLSEDVTMTYLTHDIRYRLGDAELVGLRRFLELAAKHGIVEEAPRVVLADRSTAAEIAGSEDTIHAGCQGHVTSGGTP